MRQVKNKKYSGVRKTQARSRVQTTTSGFRQVPCPAASHHSQNQAPAPTVARTRTRRTASCRSETAGTKIDLVVTCPGAPARVANAPSWPTLLYRYDPPTN